MGTDFDKADQPGGDGTRHVTLYLLQDADNSLERDVTRNPLSSTAAVDAEVLAKNVAGFGVSYFDGTNWADAWDSSSQNTALPVAAEVTVVIKAPTKADPDHTYKASRIIPLSCGRTADQATADTAAATAASSSTSGSSTMGGTQ